MLELSRNIGIGAQFGGKYFCHDVRVIRLPRHGASLPVGIGVSCSADRQILAKLTPDGVFLEQLETDPAKYLPETTDEHLGDEAVAVDLNRPMAEILPAVLGLSGEDARHAERHDGGGARHRACEAEGAARSRRGPAGVYQGPSGLLCRARRRLRRAMPPGQFGPTTAGRMDSYVAEFQEAGGSLVMLAKGNRSRAVKRGVQGEWRVLSRQRRRAGGAAGAGLHPQGGGAGVSRTRHGSGVADRGGGFPCVHRDRRQGERFLRRDGVGKRHRPLGT